MQSNAPTGGKSTALRQNESIAPTVTIHVVCRECPHEQLIQNTRADAITSAKQTQLDHAIDAGHTETVPAVVADGGAIDAV